MKPAVTVEKVDDIHQRLRVTVDAQSVTMFLNQAYDQIRQEAKIKGFRKGKVPRAVLEQQFQEEAHRQAVEALVRSSYPEAVTQSGLDPVSPPHIEVGTFAPASEYSYAAVVETKPELALEGYTGIKLERAAVSIDSEAVEEQMTAMRDAMAQLVPTDDGEVLAGTVVTVDFSGRADGKPFEGSDATDFILEVGEGKLIKAFEDQMVGMKAGETREIAFSYPDDYFNLSLAGSQAIYQVTIKEVKHKVLPEMNEDFAKSLGAFDSLDAVRTAIREQLTQQAEQSIRDQLGHEVLQKILEKNAVAVPKGLLGWELEQMYRQLTQQAKAEGKTLEELGITTDAFVEEHEATARLRVQSKLVLEAIAASEACAVEDADVEGRLQAIAQGSNETLPKVRHYYEEQNLMGPLREELLREKALDFVLEKAKIKVKKVKKTKKT
jgi:trigger factor